MEASQTNRSKIKAPPSTVGNGFNFDCQSSQISKVIDKNEKYLDRIELEENTWASQKSKYKDGKHFNQNSNEEEEEYQEDLGLLIHGRNLSIQTLNEDYSAEQPDNYKNSYFDKATIEKKKYLHRIEREQKKWWALQRSRYKEEKHFNQNSNEEEEEYQEDLGLPIQGRNLSIQMLNEDYSAEQPDNYKNSYFDKATIEKEKYLQRIEMEQKKWWALQRSRYKEEKHLNLNSNEEEEECQEDLGLPIQGKNSSIKMFNENNFLEKLDNFKCKREEENICENKTEYIRKDDSKQNKEDLTNGKNVLKGMLNVKNFAGQTLDLKQNFSLRAWLRRTLIGEGHLKVE